MVTFPDDYDPSNFDNQQEDGPDEDYRPTKLSDFEIENRGATVRLDMVGSYILPAHKENLDLILKLLEQINRVQTLYIDGKKYRKIDESTALEPTVYIDAKGVYLRDKKLLVDKNTPMQEAITAMVIDTAKAYGGIKDD